MEGIIPVIIIMIISAFFKNKKNPEEESVNKAPQTETVSENPFKGLGDLGREFMEKQQQRVEIKQEPPVVKVAPVVFERAERTAKRDQGEARSSGRMSVFQDKNPEMTEPKATVNSIFPSSKEELIKSIIFAEVLAPPKSKR